MVCSFERGEDSYLTLEQDDSKLVCQQPGKQRSWQWSMSDAVFAVWSDRLSADAVLHRVQSAAGRHSDVRITAATASRTVITGAVCRETHRSVVHCRSPSITTKYKYK